MNGVATGWPRGAQAPTKDSRLQQSAFFEFEYTATAGAMAGEGEGGSVCEGRGSDVISIIVYV